MLKLEFILRRSIASLFVLIGVSIITFFIARVVPSNPAELYIGPKARPADIERVTKQLGLDKPLPVQYLKYMDQLIHGDLGTSIASKRPVLTEIGGRLPATLELLFSGIFLAVIIGVPLGVLSARWQGKFIDVLVRIFSIQGVSMPAFYYGLLLQIVFFRELDLLPLAGRVSGMLRYTSPIEATTGFFIIDTLLARNWVAFKDVLWHLALPALTLSLYPSGLIARMTRASMLEVLEQDYIRTARAYGIREAVVTYFYALKNALSPTLTIIGLTIAHALTGSFFVEIIYNWPGMGFFTVRSLTELDYPAIMGVCLFGAFGYTVLNFIVDILQGLIDPRISIK